MEAMLIGDLQGVVSQPQHFVKDGSPMSIKPTYPPVGDGHVKKNKKCNERLYIFLKIPEK